MRRPDSASGPLGASGMPLDKFQLAGQLASLFKADADGLPPRSSVVMVVLFKVITRRLSAQFSTNAPTLGNG